MLQTFDDGSTLDVGATTVSSTPAPNGWLPTDYGGNFTPAAATPGASSWDDVLRYGFGRLIDYAVPSQAPQNVAPSLQQDGGSPQAGQAYAPPASGGAFGLSQSTLIMGAVVLLGVGLVAAMSRKG